MSTRSFMAGEKPSKKPVIPLRYRIDPTAKKLDDLDALEAELQRGKDKLEADTFSDLSDILQRQREAVTGRRSKLLPHVRDYVSPWLHSDIVPKRKRYRSYKGTIFWILFVYVVVKMLTH